MGLLSVYSVLSSWASVLVFVIFLPWLMCYIIIYVHIVKAICYKNTSVNLRKLFKIYNYLQIYNHNMYTPFDVCFLFLPWSNPWISHDISIRVSDPSTIPPGRKVKSTACRPPPATGRGRGQVGKAYLWFMMVFSYILLDDLEHQKHSKISRCTLKRTFLGSICHHSWGNSVKKRGREKNQWEIHNCSAQSSSSGGSVCRSAYPRLVCSLLPFGTILLQILLNAVFAQVLQTQTNTRVNGGSWRIPIYTIYIVEDYDATATYTDEPIQTPPEHQLITSPNHPRVPKKIQHHRLSLPISNGRIGRPSQWLNKTYRDGSRHAHRKTPSISWDFLAFMGLQFCQS